MVSKPVLIKITSMAALALILVQTAHARPIRIDSNIVNFPSGGQAWGSTSFMSEGTTERLLPFSLAIGAQSYSGVCISERGFVWFSGGACDPAGALAASPVRLS